MGKCDMISQEVNDMSNYVRNDERVKYTTEFIKTHYDRVEIRLPIGYKEKLKEVAEKKGLSVNQYMKQVIDAELE